MACVRRGDEHPAGEPGHGAYQTGSRSVPISAKLRHMTRVAEYPLRFLVKGTALRGIAGAPATGLCVGGPCQSTGQNQVRHPICKPICKRDAARQTETGRRAPPQATTGHAAAEVRPHVGDGLRHRRRMSDAS